MEKISFLRKVQPTTVEVMGTPVCLLFTMGAAAEMEDVFGQPYLQTVCDMLQVPLETGGKLAPPLSVQEQALLISILARAAGNELPLEEIEGLPMPDFTVLAQAVQTEIITKTPWTREAGAKKA